MSAAPVLEARGCSREQEAALRAIGSWLRDPVRQVFYLAGYAGTGKTTLAQEVATRVRGLTLFAAYTGKAASVLRTKGCPEASMLHSLIYACREVIDYRTGRKRLVFEKRPDSPLVDASLLIIDECSVLNAQLGRDVESFRRKILVLGDPEQLPPVEGAGYFTARRPDHMLTEIHRQAADSPIIHYATLVRQGEPCPPCARARSGG